MRSPSPVAREPAPSKVLITVDAVGGVWPHALELARGFGLAGIETVLAVLGPAPSQAQRAAAAGIPGALLVVTDLPLEWTAAEVGAVEAAGRRIARLAADLRVDLVHLATPALAASAPFLCPVVAGCHSCLTTWWSAVRGGPLPEDFLWRASLTGRGLSRSDVVVVPSAAFGRALSAAYGLPRFPEVVWNGRTAAAGRIDPDLSAFVFTAGRLWDEGKNVETLDRVAARSAMSVLAAGPIAGPNGARVAPAALRLLGELSEAGVAEQLARRPVFVSLARYEPFGLAVLEAAQHGCPLVLSDIPTFRELWDGAALFAEPDDDEAVAGLLERIAADPVAADALGRAAADRAARYTPDAMVAGMLAVYRGVLDRDERCEAAE